MRRFVLIGCILCSTASSASIKDFWQSHSADVPTFRSTKSISALELCLGMEISEKFGVPVVLHGERETVITAVSGGLAQVPIVGVRIIDRGENREIVVGSGKSLKNRLETAVQTCA